MIFHCKAGYPALFLYHENSIQWYYEKQMDQTDSFSNSCPVEWTNCAGTSSAPRTYLFIGNRYWRHQDWEFFCSGGQNSGKWKKIEVPCNWELQGFGEYTYGRWYTIKGERPSDETGIYRYKFESPATTSGERIKYSLTEWWPTRKFSSMENPQARCIRRILPLQLWYHRFIEARQKEPAWSKDS